MLADREISGGGGSRLCCQIDGPTGRLWADCRRHGVRHGMAAHLRSNKLGRTNTKIISPSFLPHALGNVKRIRLTCGTSPVDGREAGRRQQRRPRSADAGAIGTGQQPRQQRPLDGGSTGPAGETGADCGCFLCCNLEREFKWSETSQFLGTMFCFYGSAL